MAKKIDHLSSEFIVELFKACFEKERVFAVVKQYLKYSYLVEEHEKKFWKEALRQFGINNKRPTLGRIQIELRKDEAVVDYIVKIKNTDVSDPDDLIEAFQKFIRQSKFVVLFEETANLFNRGDQTKALGMFIKGAEDLSEFSIKDKYFEKVFTDYDSRHLNRLNGDSFRRKVPCYINEIDELTYGGPETGETILILGESGLGKSQALVHFGVNTARRGGKVAHFQLEGTKEQCLNRYDASWTGSLYHDIKNGVMSQEKYKSVQKVLSKIKTGEVYVEAFEKFGGASIYDIRNSYRDMKRMYGEFDEILIDYFELMELGDGVVYHPRDERFRQEKLGRLLKEWAMEDNILIITPTQSMDIVLEKKNDADFVTTRSDLSEAKGKLRPFDHFWTLNQTWDERKEKRLRIFLDKMREYKSGQTIHIATNFERSRFYDRKRTIEIQDLKEEEEN